MDRYGERRDKWYAAGLPRLRTDETMGFCISRYGKREKRRQTEEELYKYSSDPLRHSKTHYGYMPHADLKSRGSLRTKPLSRSHCAL